MNKWAVLSGGGSKGAFQLGVICKLKELEPELEYNGFAGTSVGALSLVRKKTEEWSIYLGNPAKKIASRKKDLLELEKQYLEKEGQL